jgi:hypothetical protein
MQSTIEENNKYIEAMQGCVEENASFQCIISPLKRYGGLQKATDKPTLIAAVGSVIIALMSVLMWKTMSLSRLCVVCDALFQNFIFGVDATKTMLSKLQKIFFREQCATFAPWKVLRAINLSSVGGLNYNGLETLRNVEDLERYQWGALPSMSAVQRASYELQHICQNQISFEKKECAIGEMYQYNYNFFLWFILKIFHLEEIAQSKSVELSITLHSAELCDMGYLILHLE